MSRGSRSGKSGTARCSEPGFHLFGGMGYEFARHWSVEVDVIGGITEAGAMPSLRVTVGGLAS